MSLATLAALTVLSISGCGGVQGSCGGNTSGAGSCQEFSGFADTELPTVMNLCGGGVVTGMWSARACPRTGAGSSCSVSNLGRTTTTVYYAGDREQQRSSCMAMGGAFATF